MAKLTLAEIQNGCGPDKEWKRNWIHRVHPDQVGQNKYWWSVPDVSLDPSLAPGGIFLLGADKPLRSKSTATVKRCLDRFAAFEGSVAVPEIELVLAVMATESGGRLPADRREPNGEYSFGLMQTITATAHALNRSAKVLPPELKPVLKGGNPKDWKHWLDKPHVSITLGLEMLKQVSTRFDLRDDPVLTYACYNAGSPRPSMRTPYGLVYHDHDGMGPVPGAMDNFAAFYGDACALLS